MFKYKTKGSGKRGFTLVELVIVIAVIAVLAAVLVPTFTSIIDSANNSADTQLVANMNTVLATNLDENATASAENLRKLLKDNGYEAKDLVTQNKDVVIVYDKDAKQFTRMNVKQTTNDKISLMKFGDEGQDVLAKNPYSLEEIFAGGIIVSTGGNDFAEALYQLHNLPTNCEKADVDKLIDKIQNSGVNANASVMAKHVINSTVFVDEGGEPHYFGDEGTNPSRVIFNENVKEFKLDNLVNSTEFTFEGLVVLPDTLTRAYVEDTSDSNFSNFEFAGKVELLEYAVENNKIDPNHVKHQTLDEAKQNFDKGLFLVLFTVEYKTADEGKYSSNPENYPDDNKLTSLKAIDNNGNTVIYFVQSLAPEAASLKYTESSKTVEKAKTDPNGTLFYAAWQKFVANAEAADVKFTLNADITLWYAPFTINETQNKISQNLAIGENDTVDFNMNGYKITYGVAQYSISSLVSNSGNLNIHDGNITLTFVEATNGSKNNPEIKDYFMINCSDTGKLTAANLEIKASYVEIEMYYYLILSGISSSGDLTLNGVTINMYNTRTSTSNGSYGVQISGGKASIDGLTVNGAYYGVDVIKTATEDYAGVNILNSDINTYRSAICVGGNDQKNEDVPFVADRSVLVNEIKNCTLSADASSNDNKTLWINGTSTSGDNTYYRTVTINSIKDCVIKSAYNAIYAEGASKEGENTVTIKSISGCTISSISSGRENNMCGLNLVKNVTVEKLKDCTVIADTVNYGGKATAVYVGTGSKLNMVLDDTNNYFAATGNGTTELFNIAEDAAVTLNSTTFNAQSNVSTETEDRNSYQCHKLQNAA